MTVAGTAGPRAAGGALAGWIDAGRRTARPAGQLHELVRRDLLRLPLPGRGNTWCRWLALAGLGRYDLPLARLAEGHADAVAIMAEAASDPAPAGAVLGVWAAGPLQSLEARPVPGGWRLHGVRRWCSGAGSLSHALVTAALHGSGHLLLVDLRQPAISVVPGSWPAVGMAASDTYDVRFDGAWVAQEGRVGGPGFYLQRAGFWLGAMGVAAVWWGGARGVADVLAQPAEGDPHRLAHLGAVHARLWAMEAALSTAARLVDEGTSGGHGDTPVLARTVRHVVERGAAEVIDRVGRATGAGPLGHDGAHAHRVADLTVYLRQSHAEADLADLGARLAGGGGTGG